MTATKTEYVSTPYHDLFENIKQLQRLDWSSFTYDFERLHRRLSVLDEAPRHDTMLSDEELRRAMGRSFCPYHLTFDRSNRAFGVAQAALQRALDAVQGMFAGELKVQLEDRLARHVRETNDLIDVFNAAWDEHRNPRQPFAIRRQSVGRMCYRMNGFIERVKQLKEIATRDKLTEIVPILAGLLPKLYRVRSELAKCRDNPSQKMGRRSAQWFATMSEIDEEINRIRRKCEFEMLRGGCKFSGRCGQVTAMWVPSMEGADPWTFDPDPHMHAYWARHRELTGETAVS